MQPNDRIQKALSQLETIKSRVKPVSVQGPKQREETTERIYKGVRIVDDAETEKCRIFFPSIPSPMVRTFLKKHGFQWSANDNCWQADRSSQANYYAEKAADKEK